MSCFASRDSLLVPALKKRYGKTHWFGKELIRSCFWDNRMELWSVLAEILLLVGLAFAFGTLSKRLRQSPIIGYLAAGVVAGPVLFNKNAVTTMAELGVDLMLFSIGLEFSVSRLKAMGSRILGAGVLQIVLTALLFVPLLFLAFPLGRSLTLGILLSFSSTAVVLRVLIENTMLDSVRGRIALAILLVQDLAVVPFLLVLSFFNPASQETHILIQAVKTVAGAAGLIFIFYLAFYQMIPKLMMTRGFFAERELVVLLAILSALGAIWGAHALGLSPALGAFIAGMLLGESPFASQIRSDIGSIRILFLTLFFTSIGMLLDPRWMLSHIHLVAISTLLIFFIKTLAASGSAFIAGLTRRQALTTGITLAQIGEFSLVAASTAAQNRIIGEEILTFVVGVTVLSLFLTPYLVVYAQPLAGFLLKRLAGERSIPEEESRSGAPDMVCGICIIGFGPAGQRVAEALMKKNWQPEIIELNPISAKKAQDMGLIVHQGDATSLDFIKHCRIEGFRVVVIAIPDPSSAQTLIRHVRTLSSECILVVRARYDITCQSLKAAGADILVNEENLVGEKLAEALSAVMEKDGTWEMACGIAGSHAEPKPSKES
ncbi:MAG: hypothetical protein COS92_01670 [Desulfobacterales bacterium CG07_land_8_20_14_0_80_52_14]|nr:MAG: hypothetical protein COX20_10975 [Desulfobacterales bacterium CG23_combo_of_CG06-09_8_20_14_all_52_9]PIU50381.1 MAG: hypothetical protein COS92_01670 [Desulfobacterales bacterium CG07_land_8_20_14_0_80_52_14]